jgi:hypothetical protein
VASSAAGAELLLRNTGCIKYCRMIGNEYNKEVPIHRNIVEIYVRIIYDGKALARDFPARPRAKSLFFPTLAIGTYFLTFLGASLVAIRKRIYLIRIHKVSASILQSSIQ